MSKYRRLRYRLGSANKAKVAVANRLARSVYKVLGGRPYKELGYARGAGRSRRDERRVKNLFSQLRNMGFTVQKNVSEVIVSETIKVTSLGEILT